MIMHKPAGIATEKGRSDNRMRFLIIVGILFSLMLLNIGVVGAQVGIDPNASNTAQVGTVVVNVTATPTETATTAVPVQVASTVTPAPIKSVSSIITASPAQVPVVDPVLQQAATDNKVMLMHNITTEQRLAAARNAAAQGLVVGGAGKSASTGYGITAVPLVPVPGGTPDYFGPYSNYANSQMPQTDGLGNVIPGTGIRKFVDSLPGLGPAGANDLGNYIPVAVADTTSYPGSDFYGIALVRYYQKMHSDIDSTPLMGYVQIETNNVKGAHIALSYPNGSPILD